MSSSETGFLSLLEEARAGGMGWDGMRLLSRNVWRIKGETSGEPWPPQYLEIKKRGENQEKA